jgi:hypothetical protein
MVEIFKALHLEAYGVAPSPLHVAMFGKYPRWEQAEEIEFIAEELKTKEKAK